METQASFPVSFGLLSGRAHHLGPIRRTPMHPCHIDLGVKFLDAGAWKRPDSYTNPQKEALTVREGIGIIDVSTLGKIELSGPDVIDFMHFMLPGKFAKLEVGRTRYAIMIGEDGILFEDGTISQIEKGKKKRYAASSKFAQTTRTLTRGLEGSRFAKIQ